MGKLQRLIRRDEIDSFGTVFLRHDVFELLLAATPDRGKISQVMLDWSDADLLREMLRRRFVFNGLSPGAEFEQVWPQIAVSHIGGEESSQYLIDRCLMRPRALIELLQQCRSHAVNLGHIRIEVDDIEAGEASYSTNLVTNIGFEIQDIYPELGDLLYEFIGSSKTISAEALATICARAKIDASNTQKVVDLLLWYAFLGLVREDGEHSYIYAVKYDMKRLKALIAKRDNPVYCINPAFWAGLEVSD